MSQGGNSGIQPDGALTLGDQETQEHAKRRGALLGYCPPAGVTSLQNKRSQPAGIKPARLLSKSAEQLANVDAVVIEGPISGAALSMHPLAEGQQQSWIVNRGFGRAPGNDPGISHVVQEQTRAMDHSQLLRMTVVWATASTQMAVEPRQRLFIQLARWHAVPTGPIDEVFRRSEMFARGNGGVACLR